jgi:hypothetical protein
LRGLAQADSTPTAAAASINALRFMEKLPRERGFPRSFIRT